MATLYSLKQIIERQSLTISNQDDQIRSLKVQLEAAQLALREKLPDFDYIAADSDWASQNRAYHANEPIRDAARLIFRGLLEWCGRNLGSQHETPRERMFGGLAQLVYLRDVEPHEAVYLAIHVCEQHNYHDRAAALDRLYRAMTAPVVNKRREESTERVNWWAL